MNKEKYLEIRKVENEKSDCSKTRKKIEKFLDKYNYYIDSFKSTESKEAIKRIKRYIVYLTEKPCVLSKIINQLIEEYRNNCHHEIVFEENDNYYCPLCRRYVPIDEVPKGAMIISVSAIYNLESPRQCESIYKAIDYILENNLETEVDEASIAIRKSIPHMFLSMTKDSYKVRRKI